MQQVLFVLPVVNIFLDSWLDYIIMHEWFQTQVYRIEYKIFYFHKRCL